MGRVVLWGELRQVSRGCSMNTRVDERQKREDNPQFDRKPMKVPIIYNDGVAAAAALSLLQW